MIIYTGQYRHIEVYKEANLLLVPISRSLPKELKLEPYLPLCPTWQMSKMKEAELRPKYGKQLQALNPYKTIKELEKQADGYEGIVLLAWEAFTVFSHRNLAAAWISQNSKYKVKQFDAEKFYETRYKDLTDD
jgi:hypothetical protein